MNIRSNKIILCLVFVAPLYKSSAQAHMIPEPPPVPSKSFYQAVLEATKPSSCVIVLKHSNRPVHTTTFKKSLEEFQIEVAEARNLHPGVFTEIQMQPFAYRVDARDPLEIRAAGGFWPNASKSESRLTEHTVRSAGSGSYVSFSWEHNEAGIVKNAFFIPDQPSFVITGTRAQRLTPEDWANLKIIEFERDSSGKVLGEPPEYIGWILYEYRLANLEATKVVGGSFTGEKEIIARGADLNLHPETEFRKVVITATMLMSLNGDQDGHLFERPVGGDKVHTHVEYGPWQSITALSQAAH